MLVALDESTEARLRMDTPSAALAAVLATLTSIQSTLPQLTLLKKKLQTTALSSPPIAIDPLSAYPLEIQIDSTAICNFMMQGELVWVHTTNNDESPIQINK